MSENGTSYEEKNNNESLSEEERKSRQRGSSPQIITLAKSQRSRTGDESKQSAWLSTFTDLAALMLTFFVLLYAMSEPEPQVWSEIVSSMERELWNTYGPMEAAGPNDTINLDKINLSRALKLEYLMSILETHMGTDIQNKNIIISQHKNDLVVSLPQEILFESGSANMNAQGENTLMLLANALRRIRNRIEVVGHTDKDAISTAQFPSNWELSLDRAAAVAQVLNQGGYVRPVLIRGYGSVQFDNINEKYMEDVRKDFSRRVDIHIMKDDGSVSIIKKLNF